MVNWIRKHLWDIVYVLLVPFTLTVDTLAELYLGSKYQETLTYSLIGFTVISMALFGYLATKSSWSAFKKRGIRYEKTTR